MIASGIAQTRPNRSWTKRAVAPALLAAALWFRLAVAVSPLNEATIGTLWKYDYRAAVNAAAGFGFVHDAPPDRRQLSPLSAPVALSAIARSFEPLELDEQPYFTTFRMPGYSAASALAMRITGTTSVQPLIDLQLVLDSLVPLLTFLILNRLTNGVCALVGAILSAFWLPEAAHASVYYATAPIPFLLILSVWLHVEAIHRASLTLMALFGMVSLAIAFLRLELILIPLLLSAFTFVLPLGSRRRAPFALLPTIILVAGLASLIVRNTVTIGEPLLTSQAGGTLWQGMGYGSRLFPQYQGLYDDAALWPHLASRGIVISPRPGTFYDGPLGVETSRALLRLFWAEVLRERPFDLALHLTSKLIANYWMLHNWQDALKEFGYGSRANLVAAAAWMDALILVLPAVVVVLIRWREPRERLLAVPLVCLLGLHLALMVMVAGPLRYTVGVSPSYPILIGIVLWLIATRARWLTEREVEQHSWVAVLMLAIVIVPFLWWRIAGWPRADANERLLDVSLMPAQTLARTAVSRLGLTLRPAASAPRDVNVAANRTAVFSSAPYYPGITGEDDALQLTDGVVDDDGNHQSPTWVGWGMHAPIVFVAVPLDRPAFVTRVRVHSLQGAFPIGMVRIWEQQPGGRTLLSSYVPAAGSQRAQWLSIPLDVRLGEPVIELQPGNLRDRYLFLDEIEVLAGDVYEAAGEFVSEPIRLLERSPGVPTPIGELPPGTSVELSYRRAGTAAWHVTGWNDDYFEGPVQFRLLLRANGDGRRAPLVSHIRLR